MKILCPRCGETIEVNGVGRKPLNISVKIICDTLLTLRNMQTVADKLKCSRGYIYKVLKANNLRLKDVLAK